MISEKTNFVSQRLKGKPIKHVKNHELHITS